MVSKFSIFLTISLAIIVLAWPLRLFDSDARACKDLTNPMRIEACTRTINSSFWYFDNAAWAYSSRGNAYRKAGAAELALADYDQSIRLSSGRSDTYYSRGLAYQDKKDLDHAIADYTHAIDTFNLRVSPLKWKRDYLNSRAIAYVRKGSFALAMADYEAAIRLAPQDTDLYYNRGLLFKAMNENDHAIADFTRAISGFDVRRSSTKDKRDYLSARASAFRSIGNFVGAMADYNDAIDRSPADAESYYKRALLYSAMQDPDHAIADYTRAIANFDRARNSSAAKCDYLTERGNSYKTKGNVEMAAADYDQATAFYSACARAVKARATLAGAVNQ